MDINKIRIENLITLIEESNSLNELAHKADTAPSYLSQLKNGTKTAAGNTRKVGDHLARNLENAMNKPEFWMDSAHYNLDNEPITNEVREDNRSNLPPGKYQFIPYYNIEISGGNGHQNHEYEEVEKELAFRSDWLAAEGLTSNTLAVVTVSGESMMPRLHNGDKILIKTTCLNIQNGKVYALRYGNELKVKRLELRYDGALIINSDNPSPEYKQEIIPHTDLEHIKIIGRVVKLVSGGGF